MLSFVRQAMREIKQTGSFWPSSTKLSRVMTRSLRDATGPKRLLEVGPGTGPFTKAMLESLKPGDELHLVEINPAFCQDLEQRLLGPFRRNHPGCVVVLHNSPIESAPIDGPFDFVICGLPFNNFPPDLVRAIFRRMLSLLHPTGELIWFEYLGVRTLKRPLVGADGRRRIRQLDAINRVLRRRHDAHAEIVFANLPPAVAISLRPAPERSGDEPVRSGDEPVRSVDEPVRGSDERPAHGSAPGAAPGDGASASGGRRESRGNAATSGSSSPH